MGFLKRFIKSTTREESPVNQHSSFATISETELEEHLSIARYGSFLLTDAVRPSFDLDVVPSAGYRRDVYRDQETGADVPVIMAAESRERLFDLFLDLLEPLGDEVDVVLETSHRTEQSGHEDLYRERMDLPVLKSTLYDFEDLLLDDGCTGIAVLNPRVPLEVQFDEHKLLIIYGKDLLPFEETLGDYNLRCSSDLRFVTESEHVHSTSEEFCERFEQLKYRLAVEDEPW